MPDMEFFAQRPAVVPQIYAYTLPDVTTHQRVHQGRLY